MMLSLVTENSNNSELICIFSVKSCQNPTFADHNLKRKIKYIMITVALICFPLLIALVLFYLHGDKLVKWTALVGSLAEAGWALFAWINYLYYCKCSLRFEAFWLELMGIPGKFGMNDLSMALTLVMTFLVLLMILFTWKKEISRRGLLYGALFLVATLVILVAAGAAG